MTLGEYIKNYREEHDKMSYRAFAALVGLSPQYVINLEKGLNNDGKPLSATADYTESGRRAEDLLQRKKHLNGLRQKPRFLIIRRS